MEQGRWSDPEGQWETGGKTGRWKPATHPCLEWPMHPGDDYDGAFLRQGLVSDLMLEWCDMIIALISFDFQGRQTDLSCGLGMGGCGDLETLVAEWSIRFLDARVRARALEAGKLESVGD